MDLRTSTRQNSLIGGEIRPARTRGVVPTEQSRVRAHARSSSPGSGGRGRNKLGIPFGINDFCSLASSFALAEVPPPVSKTPQTKLRSPIESTKPPKKVPKTKLSEADTCRERSSLSPLESARLEAGLWNEAEKWKLALCLCLLFLVPMPARAFQQSSSQSPVQPLDDGSDSSQPVRSTQASPSSQEAPIALPPELAALLQQAEDDLQRKNYQGALEPLKKVTSASPQTAAAWYYLGYAEHGLHNDDEARQAYQKAVGLQPDLAEAQVNLGSLLLAGRDFTGALPHLLAAVKLKPNDARAHQDLALALDGAGQHEAAAQEFQRAAALDPNSGTTLLAAGHVELGQKHYAEAAADLTKALALGADKAEAERDLAMADEALGQMPEAAQHLAAHLKLQPSDTAARLHLARIYLGQKQTDLALAELRQLDSQSLSPDIEASLGDAYALAGDFSGSEAHYRRALQVLGGEASLHRALAETLLKENKTGQAEAEFRKALAIEPGNSDALKGLASSIYLAGRYAEAAPMIERLLESPDASPGLYFILATCYDHVRDRPRALAAYKQYLARANGSNPDQEWQARQRVSLLSREIAKGI